MIALLVETLCYLAGAFLAGAAVTRVVLRRRGWRPPQRRLPDPFLDMAVPDPSDPRWRRVPRHKSWAALVLGKVEVWFNLSPDGVALDPFPRLVVANVGLTSPVAARYAAAVLARYLEGEVELLPPEEFPAECVAAHDMLHACMDEAGIDLVENQTLTCGMCERAVPRRRLR